MKFVHCSIGRGLEQPLHELDKIPVRDWFFEKMDRAKTANLLPLLRQMDASQNDGPRIWMTRAQVVQKILTKVRGRIDVENEKDGLHSEHECLRFFQRAGQFYQRIRRGFVEGAQNGRSQLFIWLQNQNLLTVFRFLFLHRVCVPHYDLTK